MIDMPLVFVRWVDSSSGGHWQFGEDIYVDVHNIETIGWLFSEAEDRITIVSSHSLTQALGALTIPKCAITERWEITL